MVTQSASLPLAIPPLDRAGGASLQDQLYAALRLAVLEGRLSAGARLPPTRLLATDLGVSRNTVAAVFDRLVAEGYLEARVGDGTYVTRSLPDDLLHARRPAGHAVRLRHRDDGLSERGRLLLANPVSMERNPDLPRAFRPASPNVDAFPRREWARLVDRRLRQSGSGLLGYGDPAGHRPLREAIAAYLGMTRGVNCEPGQIIVVGGSQQGLDLVARMLLDPGDVAAIEEPGYPGARAALLAAGARLLPIPVDGEGIVVGPALAGARLIYTTPSHQFPLGATMSLSRRLALLAHAAAADAWVLEDDYDGEYRYSGRPLPALQGLDADGRVIYLGTFSKVLFPALRIGYLVVPPPLVDAFTAARTLADRGSPLLEQAALADFVAGGHFARHIRRTRLLYAERQRVLVESARRALGGLLEVGPAEAGMHLVGRLPTGTDDQLAWRRAAANGVSSLPLSACALGEAPFPGLLLGYAAPNADEIRSGVERLRRALATLR